MSACLLQIPEPHAGELAICSTWQPRKYVSTRKRWQSCSSEKLRPRINPAKVMDHLAVVKANTEIEGKAH